MGKLLVLIGIVSLTLVVACTEFASATEDETLSLEQAVVEQEVARSRSSRDRRGSSGSAAPMAAAATPESFVEKEAVMDAAAQNSDSGNGALETAQRKVISTASISVEVDVVETATNEVRSIAENLGGFVEQLSSTGRAEQQRATITIRVPQDKFLTAMEHIEGLGF